MHTKCLSGLFSWMTTLHRTIPNDFLINFLFSLGIYWFGIIHALNFSHYATIHLHRRAHFFLSFRCQSKWHARVCVGDKFRILSSHIENWFEMEIYSFSHCQFSSQQTHSKRANKHSQQTIKCPFALISMHALTYEYEFGVLLALHLHFKPSKDIKIRFSPSSLILVAFSDCLSLLLFAFIGILQIFFAVDAVGWHESSASSNQVVKMVFVCFILCDYIAIFCREQALSIMTWKEAWNEPENKVKSIKIALAILEVCASIPCIQRIWYLQSENGNCNENQHHHHHHHHRTFLSHRMAFTIRTHTHTVAKQAICRFTVKEPFFASLNDLLSKSISLQPYHSNKYHYYTLKMVKWWWMSHVTAFHNFIRLHFVSTFQSFSLWWLTLLKPSRYMPIVNTNFAMKECQSWRWEWGNSLYVLQW